tara:strand:- start:19430 stop:20617 length:1188 start_codon:yes stop_codon:yes gene_type:complete
MSTKAQKAKFFAIQTNHGSIVRPPNGDTVSLPGVSALLTQQMYRILLRSAAALIVAAVFWNLVISLTTLRLPKIERDGPFGPHYQPNSLHVHGSEGFAWIRHDEFGFNNPSGAIANRGNESERTIVVLGDSFTEALQVPRPLNFCSLLEDQLESSTVINLGMSGRSMCDALMFSDSLRERLEPDRVIVQCRIDDWLEDATNPVKDFFITPSDSEFSIVSNDSETQALKLKKDQFISIAPFIGWSYLRIRSLGLSKNSFLPGNLKPKKKVAVSKETTVRPEIAPEFKNLIDWQISELIDRYGNQLLTILYIDEISIPAGLTETPADSPLESYLFAACQEAGIDVLRTREAFLDALRNEHSPPTGFANSVPGRGHLNRIGHQKVSALLSRYLKTLNL